jgi:hypothetical protein
MMLTVLFAKIAFCADIGNESDAFLSIIFGMECFYHLSYIRFSHLDKSGASSTFLRIDIKIIFKRCSFL